MKIRYLSIILALAVILSFSSCGKRRANNSHGSRNTDTSLSADISNDVSQADSGSDSTSHPDSASGNESASESHEPASEEHNSTQTEVQESAQSTAVCEHKSTEIRGKKDATESAEGYTGDTYCKDCGKLLSKGKAIKKLESNTPSSFDMTKYEQEMFRQLNEIRAESGLAPLEWNSEIYQYAKIRAAESSEYYKNEGVAFGPDPHYRFYNGKWSDPFTVFEQYGYPKGSYMGENLAMLASTRLKDDCTGHVTTLMKNLYNSKGHRENMLNKSFTTVAIAFVDYTDYLGRHGLAAVQLFYTPQDQ